LKNTLIIFANLNYLRGIIDIDEFRERIEAAERLDDEVNILAYPKISEHNLDEPQPEK